MAYQKPYTPLPLPPEAEDYNNTPFEHISMNSSVEGGLIMLYLQCKEHELLLNEANALYDEFDHTRLRVNGGRLYTEEECQSFLARAKAIRERIPNVKQQ